MAEKPSEIVDAHMHLWSPKTHPWLHSMNHPAGSLGRILCRGLERHWLAGAVPHCRACGHVPAGWLSEGY